MTRTESTLLGVLLPPMAANVGPITFTASRKETYAMRLLRSALLAVICLSVSANALAGPIIFIVDGGFGTGTLDDDLNGTAPQIGFSTPDDGDNTLTVGALQSLGDTNIELQATDTVTVGGMGGQSSTVDLSASLTTNTNTLTLTAGDGSGGAGDVTFNTGSSISTGGGSVAINAGDAGDTSGNANLGAINTSGGAVTVNAIGSVVVAADIDAGSGQIDISVDIDEATTDGAESLEIQAALTADTINLSGGAAVQNDSLIVSLAGIDTADWNVNVADGGTLDTGTSDTANFTNFSNLAGGDQADTFTFTAALTGTAAGGGGNDTFAINDGGSAGTIDGGDDNDTVTYAGRTAGVIASIADFTSVENLVGSFQDDTLQGTEGANVFTIDSVNAGNVDGVNFNSFENLDGLGGADTYVFDAGSFLSGSIGFDGLDALLLFEIFSDDLGLDPGDDLFLLGFLSFDSSNLFFRSSAADSFAFFVNFGGFDGNLASDSFDPYRVIAAAASVPEPGTLALLGIGLAGIGLTRRKKKA